MEEHHKNLALQALGVALKAARERKGLSQRALSDKIGVPQGRISKIESGKANITAFSLIEIARALDLEFMLVSKKLVPAVEALSRHALKETEANARRPARGETSIIIDEAHRALEKIGKDATRFSRAIGGLPEMARLAETARELDQMRITQDQAQQIRELAKHLSLPKELLNDALAGQRNISEILKTKNFVRLLREAAQVADSLKNFRNALAHGAAEPAVRTMPAYRLTDGEEHD
jgi:transcriptional regulator with XRE-family HTH domain